MALHKRTHPVYDPSCFGCRAATIQFGGEKTATTLMESRWDRDMPAYRRLRDQGYQPRGIDGCADLERGATTRFEIESGRVSNDPKKLGDAIKYFEDGSGHSVFEPAVKPKETEAA